MSGVRLSESLLRKLLRKLLMLSLNCFQRCDIKYVHLPGMHTVWLAYWLKHLTIWSSFAGAACPWARLSMHCSKASSQALNEDLLESLWSAEVALHFSYIANATNINLNKKESTHAGSSLLQFQIKAEQTCSLASCNTAANGTFICLAEPCSCRSLIA